LNGIKPLENQDDLAVSVKELGKNHYVVGGYSLSGISGDKTDTSKGSYDY